MHFLKSIIAFALAAVVSTAPVPSTTAPASSSTRFYTQCNRPGVFALTFDDGPFEYTWDLAKYLHSRGVKATFFTTGYNFVKEDLRTATTTTDTDGTKTYFEVFKYLQESGHEIASHTYEHAPLVGLSVEEVTYQMNTLSDLIFEATGLRPAVMRPPRGEHDETVDRVVTDLGYSIVNWDIDTLDYQMPQELAAQQQRVREIVEADINGVTPGHISLQHDVHEQSARELTPWIVDYILSKNYTFVTVSECLGINAYL